MTTKTTSDSVVAPPVDQSPVDIEARLVELVDRARLGGSEANRAKHVAAGKLLVRDRLELLFDDGWSFEDGLLARFDEGLPGDAVVTAIGKVDGREVCVIANDYTVKAGTWGKRTFEKIIRDCRSSRTRSARPSCTCSTPPARASTSSSRATPAAVPGATSSTTRSSISGRVPQVCALFGPSPAGSAYVPALCDLTIMVRGHATAYLGSPRLAEMVTGEKVTLEEMGGAEMHCRVSGLGDVLVEDDEEAIDAIRVWLSYLPSNWEQRPPARAAARAGGGPARDGHRPGVGRRDVFDMHELIDAVVDEDTFFPYKDCSPKSWLRIRAPGRRKRRHRRQPAEVRRRGPLLRLLRQGGAVHLDLQCLQHPDPVPGRHRRLHDRLRGRARGHHPPRREDDLRRRREPGPADHGAGAQGLRRRLPRDVRLPR